MAVNTRSGAVVYFTRWGLLGTAVYALVAYGGLALLLWLGDDPAPGDLPRTMLYRSLLEVGVFFVMVSAVMFAGAGALVGWVSRHYPDAPRPLLARATTFMALVLGGALSWLSGGVLLPLVIVLAVLCWRWWH
jgi:hypothetical protein